MAANKLSVLDFITPVVHGHGRGTLLGMCLVQLQCVSCIATSVATWLLMNYLFFISLHLLSTGMDKARALVRALWNNSVSRVSILRSMF